MHGTRYSRQIRATLLRVLVVFSTFLFFPSFPIQDFDDVLRHVVTASVIGFRNSFGDLCPKMMIIKMLQVSGKTVSVACDA
jgi:hypothetical protein